MSKTHDSAVGWGILGTATIADLSVAPAIGEQDESSLVAVVSRDADRAAAFCERHSGTPYTDLDAFLADESVQAVYVASPNALHKEHVIAALEAGKHVLVEKPIAVSAEDAREMVVVAQARDRLLGVAFHLRHKPTNVAAREVVTRGGIGKVHLIQAHLGAGRSVFPYGGWRRDPSLAGGAGTLVHQGTHVLDLVRYLTGREVVAVSATADERPHEGVAAALLELDGGGIAIASSSDWRGGVRSDFTVLGDQGWMDVVGGTQPVQTRVDVHTDDGVQTHEDDGKSPFWHEVNNFEQAVLGRTQPRADGVDGLRNLEIVEAIYQAVQERRTVAVHAEDVPVQAPSVTETTP